MISIKRYVWFQVQRRPVAILIVLPLLMFTLIAIRMSLLSASSYLLLALSLFGLWHYAKLVAKAYKIPYHYYDDDYNRGSGSDGGGDLPDSLHSHSDHGYLHNDPIIHH